ncbi:MAG: hypothetical protein K2Y35_20110 [Burkholderiales bacterium]|nr:hypothetical protein [Burkholderiales bacterium]
MSESRQPYQVKSDSDVARDYRFLDADPVPLKVWLPETVEAMVEDLAKQQDVAKAALLGRLLFAHLYGWHDLEVLLARTGGRLVHAPVEAESRSPAYRTELGKSIADIRVFVAPRMKEDLERLAAAQGLKLSAYARRVVLDQVLGRAPHPLEFAPDGDPI